MIERPEGPEPTVAPFGSWASPIRIDDVVSDVIGLNEPWIDGDDTYWLEARPSEGGRRVLVRSGVDGVIADLTPAPFNVRTRVHEYGGGSYVVAGGVAVFSNFADGRLYRLDPGSAEPVAITPDGPWRFADLRADPGRRRFVAVREDHAAKGQPAAAIVAVPLDGLEPPTVLVSGPDFLAAPRLAPDGGRLAWLEWDHPDMPWEASRLRVAAVQPDGTLADSVLIAGGPDESIAQPEWSPDGVIHFVSDRTGWWNLYRLLDGPTLDALAPMEAEFADPAWIFGRSSYAFTPDASIVAVARRDGRDHLLHIRPDELVGEVDTTYTEFDGLVAGPAGIVTVAGSPAEPTVLARLDPATLAVAGVLRRASNIVLDPGLVSVPETIHFPTSGGRTAHALYHPPRNPRFVGPEGERPPLVVLSHGGPTSNASTALDMTTQLLTSRGIAIVNVDYGGSTGYGRAYRRELNGQWGVVDVDDCVAAAQFLADRGDVDPARMAITGASAGGYTTLAALAFRDVFAAGVSRFGVGDLVTMTRDTHKFESRYLDRLVGPYPQAADTYRERSPVHFLDRISCPVLVMQGLDDRVVPPSQAEAIVETLAAKGIPHAYLPFVGEGHGFRGAAAIRRSLEAELSFLGQVFGFVPADALEPVEMPGLDAWRRRHAPIMAGHPPNG
ncbi:MAG TPA: prolyl oligopeptidase family serine peptidase [Candidatus Limnocylindrales bacterium]|nr:prolyl oligopeptidase family serine peptidase [Candidatus Limnocylindrales bacterium]